MKLFTLLLIICCTPVFAHDYDISAEIENNRQIARDAIDDAYRNGDSWDRQRAIRFSRRIEMRNRELRDMMDEHYYQHRPRYRQRYYEYGGY